LFAVAAVVGNQARKAGEIVERGDQPGAAAFHPRPVPRAQSVARHPRLPGAVGGKGGGQATLLGAGTSKPVWVMPSGSKMRRRKTVAQARTPSAAATIWPSTSVE
jgi:hypothetical protein